VRSLCRPGGEELVEEGPGRTRHLGVVPGEQELMGLRLGQQRQLGEPRLRAARRSLGQCAQMAEEPGGCRRIEQVPVVVQASGQAAAGLHGGEKEVEPGRAALDRHRRQGEARQLERARRGVLEHEHGLEERSVGEAALRLQAVDELLEGEILVGIGAERHLAHPAEDLGEGGISRQLGPEHQSVGEQPDQPLGLDLAAAGDRCAEEEVLRPGLAGQQGRPQGGESNEEGRPLLAGELAQGGGETGGQSEAQVGAAQGRGGGTRAVSGQVEHVRRAGQPLPPPADPLLQDAAVQPPALPDGVVGILDRQLRQRGDLARGEGAVARGELFDEDPDRPAVRDDVVLVEEHGVAVVLQPQGGGPHQRPPRQIERARRLLARQAFRLPGPEALRQPVQVDPGKREPEG
jgi:hypothetical protein